MDLCNIQGNIRRAGM